MGNKISELEKSILYYQSYSNAPREKKSLSPSRSDLYTNDNSESKYNSNFQENIDRKYNYDYREKNHNSALNMIESENKSLREQIKSRDKIIINLESQINELRALNKTCYDLLGQLNI